MSPGVLSIKTPKGYLSCYFSHPVGEVNVLGNPGRLKMKTTGASRSPKRIMWLRDTPTLPNNGLSLVWNLRTSTMVNHRNIRVHLLQQLVNLNTLQQWNWMSIIVCTHSIFKKKIVQGHFLLSATYLFLFIYSYNCFLPLSSAFHTVTLNPLKWLSQLVYFYFYLIVFHLSGSHYSHMVKEITQRSFSL